VEDLIGMTNNLKLKEKIHAINSTSINGTKLKDVRSVSELIQISNTLAEQNKKMAILLERIDDEILAGDTIGHSILADVKEIVSNLDGQY
jgi:hypothetical protein